MILLKMTVDLDPTTNVKSLNVYRSLQVSTLPDVRPASGFYRS